MSDVTQAHEEKETLVVDCELPGHDARVTTPLFTRTRTEMLERIGHRCQISGEPESECGPIEFHHFWVERCLANAVDAERLHAWLKLVQERATAAEQWFATQLASGKPYAEIWADPMAFTDDMTVNGLGICKRLHTGKGEGIHDMPEPLWQLWATGKPGFKFVGNDCVVQEKA